MKDWKRGVKLQIIVCALLSCWGGQSLAQNKAIVKGKVLDSLASSPLGYTSIAVYSLAEKKLRFKSLTQQITKSNLLLNE